MSDRRPFFHGWRARTHYLTRNRSFLLRTSAAIIAVGLAAACLIVLGRGPRDAHFQTSLPSAADNRVHRSYQELRHATTPQPRQLTLLLRQFLSQIPDAAGEGTAAFTKLLATGRLLDYDLRVLLQQHVTPAAPADLFEDFLAAALNTDDAALARLQKKASSSPPAMLAAELCGSVKKRRGDTTAAMHLFFSEGLHFREAERAREEALRLAVTEREIEMVHRMADQPGWIEGCHPMLQYHAAGLLNDVWMQWRGLIHHRLTEIPYGMLALALFASGLWYYILVQHSDHARLRWLRPIAAIMAGVASVWPTLTIVSYQEVFQGMTSEAPFPHDLIYFILGVGLREEVCKLALFALFLPWLLWRRTPGLALLTGAFVGLGFSLEENIGYYQDFGGAVAWTRFLSANFLHISLTGLCAHSLYQMLRSRFAHAGEFIATFMAAVAAHGGYDWLLTGKVDDNGWGSVIVLVLTVSRFIDLLAQETRPTRLTISPRAVFTFGSAILIALSFILGAWTTRSMAGVAEAGIECLAMVPIAVLYWRKFEHA